MSEPKEDIEGEEKALMVSELERIEIFLIQMFHWTHPFVSLRDIIGELIIDKARRGREHSCDALMDDLRKVLAKMKKEEIIEERISLLDPFKPYYYYCLKEQRHELSPDER